MSGQLINKYVWLVDVIRRYKRITRREINRLWVENIELSNGENLPRRTFCTYINEAQEMFNIIIACDRTNYEYYIAEDGTRASQGYLQWLTDSITVSNTLAGTREIAGRIMFENVPSARSCLPTIVDSIKANTMVHFVHHPFGRKMASQIRLNPYFLRIFEQRWYVIGYEHNHQKILTYSLDRISDVVMTDITFEPPMQTAEEFFKDCFGIYIDSSEPRDVRLRVTPFQANYFRALPLHASQREFFTDVYSVFSYKMLITPDLVDAIVRYGDKVEVIEPLSLRQKVIEALEKALNQYR